MECYPSGLSFFAMSTKPDVSANGGEMASRRDSMSNKSDDSQTAAEYASFISRVHLLVLYTNSCPSFIREQEVLEADAREALPYVRTRQCLESFFSS